MVYDNVLILKPEMVEIANDARIDSFTKIEGGQGVTIGRCVHLASFVHVGIGGGRVTIGDYAAVASGAKILSGSNQMAGMSMSASAPLEMQVIDRAHTVIDRFAFIGVNAVVMPGVRIGVGAVVGAGAVVMKNVPREAIVAGVPARVIGWRPATAKTRDGWYAKMDDEEAP